MTSPPSRHPQAGLIHPSAAEQTETTQQAAQAASRLCIDCRHFRPSDFIGYEAKVRWADCALTATTRTYEAEQLVGVTIEPTIEMESCSDERSQGGHCGPSGLKFSPADKRFEPSPVQKVSKSFFSIFK